jgi:hypothetical protein
MMLVAVWMVWMAVNSDPVQDNLRTNRPGAALLFPKCEEISEKCLVVAQKPAVAGIEMGIGFCDHATCRKELI